jgi:hypothetical protein
MNVSTVRKAMMAVLVCAGVAAGGAAMAQRGDPQRGEDRGSGGEGITVYSEANFRGHNSHFQSDVPDLRKFYLNDRVDSLQIPRGESWEVCVDINYRGRCQVFSGNEPDLGRVGWGGLVSSLRRLDRNDNRWGHGPVEPNPPTHARLVVFDDIDYRGQSSVLTAARANFGSLNKRISSVKVYGGAWELCDGPEFRGHCRTVTESIPDLRKWGMQDNLMSARPAGRGR